MKFIDLNKQYERIKDKLDFRLEKIMKDQTFIMGEDVKELEGKLAAFTGRNYCIACGSGTEALQIPLMAYGLKKDDAVFVPSFTFFASAESINLAGGTPVFVDIDDTFNINPYDLDQQIQKVLREGMLLPRGVISVDLFGRSADYNFIAEICKKYHLFLLEDAAQGFGGSLHGKRNGSFGDVSATSFFPAKPLGCYGDGGAIFTDDEELYSRMCSIRVHGAGADKYDNIRIGINGRLDTMQAAVLLEKMNIFEEELDSRQNIADWYTEMLNKSFTTPRKDKEHYSAWAQYSLLAKNKKQRDSVVAGMKRKNIPVMIYYPIPLHKQTAYKNLGYGDVVLPVCEDISSRIFSIPMHPYLEKREVEMICRELKELIS